LKSVLEKLDTKFDEQLKPDPTALKDLSAAEVNTTGAAPSDGLSTHLAMGAKRGPTIGICLITPTKASLAYCTLQPTKCNATAITQMKKATTPMRTKNSQ